MCVTMCVCVCQWVFTHQSDNNHNCKLAPQSQQITITTANWRPNHSGGSEVAILDVVARGCPYSKSYVSMLVRRRCFAKTRPIPEHGTMNGLRLVAAGQQQCGARRGRSEKGRKHFLTVLTGTRLREKLRPMAKS